jgi:hypothetical protein
VRATIASVDGNKLQAALIAMPVGYVQRAARSSPHFIA